MLLLAKTNSPTPRYVNHSGSQSMSGILLSSLMVRPWEKLISRHPTLLPFAIRYQSQTSVIREMAHGLKISPEDWGLFKKVRQVLSGQ